MSTVHRIFYLCFIFSFALFYCVVGNAHAKKRVALVIGNSAYEHVSELPNPKNDAKSITQSLSRLGFEVITGLDVTRPELVKIIRKFSKAIKGVEIALLYYAGHGLQVDGKNYLAPVDTQLLDEDDLEFETVRLEMVMKLMEREQRTNLVFLDACRNNPLSRNLTRSMGTRAASVGRGLASISTGIGTLIAFATQPGNVALDGNSENSPFTEALINHIETPGEDIAVLLRRVRSQVINLTNGKQVPWSNSSLTGSVILNEKPKEVELPDVSAEITFWNSIKESNEKRLFAAYLKNYKNGMFSELASTKIDLIMQKQEKIRRLNEVKLQAEKKMEVERLAKKQRAESLAALKAEKKIKARDRQRAKREAELLAERELSAKRQVALKEAQFQRDQLEKRLAKLKAENKIIEPKKKNNAANNDNPMIVAKLETDISKKAGPEEKNTKLAKNIIRSIQKELNRVGCSAGRPDGLWGKSSRRALKQFGKHSNAQLVSLDPSTILLERLKTEQKRICPLACKSGFEKKREKCVRIRLEVNTGKDTKGQNSKNPIALRPTTKKAKITGTTTKKTNCFVCKSTDSFFGITKGTQCLSGKDQTELLTYRAHCRQIR